MAVSSASDKQESNTVTKKKTDEYRNELEAQEKRHRNEVSKIRQQHFNEMRQTQDQYNKDKEGLRNASTKSLNQKDQYYQGEIENLQNMNKEKLRKTAETYEDKVRLARDTADSDIKQNKESTARQRESLKGNYENEISKMDEQFRNYVDDSRQKQTESYEDQRKRFLADKEKTVNILGDTHKEKTEQLERDLRTERYQRRSDNNTMKTRMHDQAENLSDSYKRTVQRDRAFNDEALSMNREASQEGIQDVRDRYDKALEKRAADQDSSLDGFRHDVNERIESKVKSLETQLDEEKTGSLANSLKKQQQHKTEVNNLRKQMRDSNELLENQKRASISSLQEQNSQDIQNVHQQDSSLLNATVRNYENKLFDDRTLQKNQLADLGSNQDLEKKELQNRTQVRINNIVEQKAKEDKTNRQYFQDNIQGLQDRTRKEKSEMRDNLDDEKRTVRDGLNRKLKETTARHANETRMQKNSYESEIARLQEEKTQDKSTAARRLTETVEALQKGHKRELETQKLASQSKMQELNNKHQEDLQRLQERHTREMEELAAHKS
jgi:hypothetical protein